MSEKYLPLFRKYRPQSFKDVVGQESLVKALSNAIELNRIANAYLFAGPRGTGKTSCARIFAKSLNCMEGPTLEPCQKCPSCLDITNASGLDVIEIDAATNRGIDDAKELIAQTQYAPMNGKYKIFIIDEVHMLSNEAFNALLKTFEEPPQNVIFILATTEPHKVIETIVSRCQRFDLRRITTDDIVKRLREISDIENIKITDDALFTIAKNVSGGLRDSLALLDQVSILGAREEITKEDIESLLGKVTFDVAFNFLNKIVAKNVQEALFSLDEIYNKGLEPKNFCENFIEFLRNLVFALSSADDKNTLKFTNFNTNDIEKIKAANFDKALIFNILDKVIEYYKEIRFTTNPYLWAELLVINLCKVETVSLSVVQEAAKPAPAVQQPKPVKPVPAFAKAEPEKSVVRDVLQEIEIPEVAETLAKPDVLQAKEEKPVMPDVPAMPEVPAEPEVPAVSETVVEPQMPEVPETFEVSDKQDMFEESTVFPETETSSVKSAVNTGLDPVTAWTNVLNAIESIPAKFFYSGVGKLVDIANKSVTLGFVNENAINQAKSESKFKHLLKALKEVLGEDYTAEFILITENVKVMDVKLNAKIQTPQKPNYVKELPEADVAVPSKNIENPAPMPEVPIEKSATENKENKDANAVNANYGRKTKEMLEAFNGRVVD